MSFVPIRLLRGWAFDTDTPLNTATTRALLAAPWPGEKRAVIRYLSLGKPSPSDISVQERDAVFIGGAPALGLVQHVEMPHWIASPDKGTDHGKYAVEHAQMIGAPSGMHLTPDIEGLGNVGAPVQQYLEGWCRSAIDAGFLVLPYDGYDDGMPAATKASLVANGFVAANAWWSDFGPRTLPTGLSWAAKQSAQRTVAGLLVDPDQILVDNVVIFMAVEDDENVPDTDPHPDVAVPAA